MTITPNPEQAELIAEAIRAGLIRSEDEALDIAVNTLRDRLNTLPRQAPRTSRLWELRKGLSLGDLSIKDLIEEGRE